MKNLFVAMLLGSLLACSSNPRVAESAATEGEAIGLYPVTGLQQFGTAYVKSEDVFKGYSQLYFAPLDLDSIEIDTSRLERKDRSWEDPTDEDKETVKHYFTDELAKYFSGSTKLPLAGAPGENALEVAVVLTRYKPNSPRDSTSGRPSNTYYFSEGPGRLYMATFVRDSVSGELLGYFEDDRELGKTWQEDSRINNARRFKMGLYTWIQRLDNAVFDMQN